MGAYSVSRQRVHIISILGPNFTASLLSEAELPRSVTGSRFAGGILSVADRDWNFSAKKLFEAAEDLFPMRTGTEDPVTGGTALKTLLGLKDVPRNLFPNLLRANRGEKLVTFEATSQNQIRIDCPGKVSQDFFQLIVQEGRFDKDAVSEMFSAR